MCPATVFDTALLRSFNMTDLAADDVLVSRTPCVASRPSPEVIFVSEPPIHPSSPELNVSFATKFTAASEPVAA